MRALLPALLLGCTPAPAPAPAPAPESRDLELSPTASGSTTSVPVASAPVASTPVASAPAAPVPTPSASTPYVPTPSSALAPKTGRAFTACTKGPESQPPFANVRAVDFCNYTLTSFFGTMRGGRSEMHEYEEMGGAHDTFIAKLGLVTFGDLDGDGVEDAAVVVDQELYPPNGVGTQRATLYVVTVKKGALVVKSTKELPYGADARIVSGKLKLPP